MAPSCCLIYSLRVPTFAFSRLTPQASPHPTFPPPFSQCPDNTGRRQRLFFRILLPPSPDPFLPSGVLLDVPHLGQLTISDCLGLSRLKNWKSFILGNPSAPGEPGQSPTQPRPCPDPQWLVANCQCRSIQSTNLYGAPSTC